MAKPDMMTVRRTAEYLGLPESTVYLLIRNGMIGHARYKTGAGRGAIRVDRDEAERYRLSCLVPAGSTLSGVVTPSKPKLKGFSGPLSICGPEKWGDGT